MRFFIISVIALAISVVPCFGQSDPLNLDFNLPGPQTKAHQTYLGILPGQSFTLNQVKADILIVEIFSMYCPICQREATKVNQLYKTIQALDNPSVKIIGIGAGNSAFEVAFFKENYKIEFPLFSDGNFHIHKILGEKGTPFFMGISPQKTGPKVFFTHSGEIKDIHLFVERLLNRSQQRN
ncbi:MAG: TlpA family protein disulfide reductase [Desulfobacter sp.]|nr:TlpA family protein disulfide reductase [Desulfobacter sp.]